MIVTDRFIFLHLHKSGGTFANKFLMQFLPDAQQVGYHLPRRMAPPAAANLPTLGFVRNPWSYYVSWYSFQKRRQQPNPLFRILSEDGQLDFEHTLANMLDLGTRGAKLAAILAALPERYTNRGLNLPRSALEPIRASGRGFYSFLYRYMYDGPGILHIRRMDHLREDLLAMLTAVGEPVTAQMRAYVRDAPPSNTSEHEPYTTYYGAALRDLVAERDTEIISRHGFRFGD